MLGLERMRRLCSLLGMPQHRFASIHVVGTNGKTSVALMTAALLQARGVRSGAYVSPHIRSWRERIVIGGEPISEEAFETAIQRAEEAARAADRAAGEEGPVTQFELVTAAAFWAFAEARVEVTAIEAGLGGRLDATNVIPSAVTVLTSVGLDHIEWLGETLEEIAAEKLAVLRDHTKLIRGELPPRVEPVVDREVERRHAEQVRPQALVFTSADFPAPSLRGYQQLNVALAWTAVNEVLALAPSARESQTETILSAMSGLRIPGRGEAIEADPPQVFDAAHNPDGARALAAVLPELVAPREKGGRLRRLRRLSKLLRAKGPKSLRSGWERRREGPKIVCCLAILAEKDAKGIIEELSPACSHFVCTEIPEEAIRGSGRPVGTSHPASTLAQLCRETGAEAEAIADPLEAWRRARDLARDRDAAALAAGSHYLLTCIWTERPAPSS